MKETLDMPVLLFNQSYSTVEFIRDKNLVTVTAKSGLKKGIVIGNRIIDSSGREYKTTGAKAKGNYFPAWKFEFFNPLIYIDLEVKKIKDEFDLPDLKNKILKIVRREKDEWANYGDVNEIKKSIEESKTHRELVSIIGKYIHPPTEK